MPNRSTPTPYPQRVWIWPAGDNAGFSTRTTRAVEVTARRVQPNDLRLNFFEPDSVLCSDGEEDDVEDEACEPSQSRDSWSTERAPVEPCPLLQCGQRFHGWQRMNKVSDAVPSADWKVEVLIHSLDLEKGQCTGLMAAHIPMAESPVYTQFDGEIIDDITNSFVTCKWGANYSVDLAHWRKFAGFRSIQKEVQQHHGRCKCLSHYPYIFMRWKESFFVNGDEDGSLTIAGFYYICLCRTSGKISGYYFDPVSMPFQKLELEPIKPYAVHRHIAIHTDLIEYCMYSMLSDFSTAAFPNKPASVDRIHAKLYGEVQ